MQAVDAKWYLRKRYLVTFLTSSGMICMVLVRTNLSIAIVEFTSEKNVTIGNNTHLEAAEFRWASTQKGIVLSLFYYGYVCAFFTGSLTAKFGGANVFGFGILITAVLSTLSPILIRLNFYIYAMARIMEGIFEGTAYASYQDIFVYWAPPNERTRLLVFSHMGLSIGSAANYAISGYTAKRLGWEAVFFITGGISIIWSLIWFLLVKNDPKDDYFISNTERVYLMEVIQIVRGKISIPWRNMITSKAFWAYVNQCFCMIWTFWFLMNALPMYIKDVTHKNIQDIGFISSIPSWIGFIAELLAAYLADYLRSERILSIPNVHMVFFAIGHIGSSVLLIITGMWMNFEESIATFSLIKICIGILLTSNQSLPVDLFSRYGSFAKGIGIAAAGIGSLLASTIMGFMVPNHTRSEWNKYFLLLSIVGIWSFVILFKYGSGELQPWVIMRKEEEVPQNKTYGDITVSKTEK